MAGPDIPESGVNQLSRNERFLQSLDNAIESNLANEQFGVEQLADSLNISRTQLFRRLQKLTGKNISQYIREYRLKKALELLKKDVASASEIAYQVGFGSPSYFNKCFHEYYGYPPVELKKKIHEGKKYPINELPGNNWLDKKPKIEARHDKQRNKRMYYLLTGIIVVIIASIVIWKYLGVKQISESDKSIAVIPFWNDSPDPDNTYFCYGIEEDIRIHLLKIADLQIESRHSVEKYRVNPDMDATAIGKELGVNYIVGGSVRKIGNDLRVAVQLIDVKTSKQIWGNIYDGNYTQKLLTFQSNTAKQIASALNAIITPEEEKEIKKVSTSDMRAYDLMMRARNEIRKYFRHARDPKSLKLAHNLLVKALEIDPQFEDAIAAISHVYSAEQNHDSAYYYAKKILEINPNSVGGFYAMGGYYYTTGNGSAAIENYELALKHHQESDYISKYNIEYGLGLSYIYFNNDYLRGLKYIQNSIIESDSMSYILGYGYFAEIFIDLGDYEKAELCNQKLLKSEDALCWGIGNTAMILVLQGKYIGAINFLDSICSISPCELGCNHFLFWLHTNIGEFDQAKKYFNQYLDVGGTPSLNDSLLFAYIYKENGNLQEAEAILNNIRISPENKITHNNFFNYLCPSMTHALLDDKEASMRYLSDVVEIGLRRGWHDLITVFPIYKNYWDDPEFEALVKQAQEERAAKRKQVDEMIERGEIDL
jgi:TolB-like protein/AraC-like DNA-binding protein/Tfp pilus assembly protein PilF